jgi:ribosomal protein L7/L12
MIPIPFLFILLTFSVFAMYGLFFSAKRAESLRARGLYPETGKETDADVIKLLKAGEKIMAIRCYRALHHAGLKEAKEAVEAIERNNP